VAIISLLLLTITTPTWVLGSLLCQAQTWAIVIKYSGQVK